MILFRHWKRRPEVTGLLHAFDCQASDGPMYVAWANASPHEGDKFEAVVRGRRTSKVALPAHQPDATRRWAIEAQWNLKCYLTSVRV